MPPGRWTQWPFTHLNVVDAGGFRGSSSTRRRVRRRTCRCGSCTCPGSSRCAGRTAPGCSRSCSGECRRTRAGSA
eukprot:2649864-Prymnesium_polylepis.1